MSDQLPDMTPVDEIFQRLLNKARGLQGSRERLEAAAALVADRQAAEANRIAARMAWRPTSSVALVEEHTCRICGHQTQVFRGFGVLMKRHADPAARIIPCASPDEGLPFHRYILPMVTDACMECLAERGF